MKILYNKLKQELFYYNNILMYSTHNKGKSAISERYMKPLKAAICKNNNS